MALAIYRSFLKLFWIPTIIAINYYYKLQSFLGWIIFEQGFITPTIYKIYVRLGRKWKKESCDLLNYLFSSTETKGDFTMGRIYGLRPDTIHEFEPKGQDDIPKEERTVFLCKFLDVNLSAQITDQVYTAKGFGNKREELLRAGTQEIAILRKGLVGWRNFFYDENTEVEWEDPSGNNKQKASAIMDRNLNKIPVEERGQIADFIRGSSTPDQD